MKNTKKLLGVISLLLLFTSCGENKSIKKVKNEIINKDKNITLETIIDHTLDNEKWEISKNDENKELVKVSGQLKGKTDQNIELFFQIDKDKILPVNLISNNQNLGPIEAVIFIGNAISNEQTNK